MHQQPPQTPLFASTSAAKSSQVSGVSRRVVYGVTADVTVLLSSCSRPGLGRGRPRGRPAVIVYTNSRVLPSVIMGDDRCPAGALAASHRRRPPVVAVSGDARCHRGGGRGIPVLLLRFAVRFGPSTGQ